VHDTSVIQIERHYAVYISDALDETRRPCRRCARADGIDRRRGSASCSASVELK
jgi:hypothetical protein